MVKIGNWIIAILVISIYFLPNIYAKEDFSIKTELKNKVVGIEEDFSYSLIIKTSKKILAKIQQPTWPKNIEFSYSSNSEQTNMQIINGHVSTTRIKKVSYTLKAKKLGWILLPSIKVLANNKVYKTKEIKIKVVKEPQAHRKTPNKQLNPLDSFFNNNFSFQKQKKNFNKKDIFVKMELNKSSLFLSEQVVLKWFLYTRLSVSSLELEALPKLKYFWKKDLNNKTRNYEQVNINNRLYQKSLLFSYVASPLKIGELNIDPLRVKTQIFDRTGFGFSSSAIRLTSQNKIVSVVGLPKLIKKGTFSGAVGDFQFNDKIKTVKIQQGKAFIWEIIIQGLGNLEAFNFNILKLGKDLELYDIQEKVEVFPSGVSKKKIELLIIPKVAGSITLPIIEFIAFNPYSKAYYSLLSKKKEILVSKNLFYLKSKITLPTVPYKKTKNINKKLQPDFAKNQFIKKINQLEKKEKNKILIYNKYFIFFFILLLLCFLLFLLFNKIKNKEKNNLLILKNKFLKIEKNILLTNEKKAARALIDLTYWTVEQAKDKKYNFLSLAKMIDELPLGYQDKYGQDLKRILNLCETIAFSKEVPTALKKQLRKISVELHSYLRILLKYN